MKYTKEERNAAIQKVVDFWKEEATKVDQDPEKIEDFGKRLFVSLGKELKKYDGQGIITLGTTPQREDLLDRESYEAGISHKDWESGVFTYLRADTLEVLTRRGNKKSMHL